MSGLLLQRDSAYLSIQVGLCLTHKAENVICALQVSMLYWHQAYCILSSFQYHFGLATRDFCCLYHNIGPRGGSFYWPEIKFYTPAMIFLKVTMKKKNVIPPRYDGETMSSLTFCHRHY